MSGKQAKILSTAEIEDLLIFAARTRCPIRNRLIILLSIKAGLRAGEIANLTWDMVLDARGEIGAVIELRDWVSKKNSGRLIPIHPDLWNALWDWRQLSNRSGAIVRSERNAAMSPVSIGTA